MAPVGASMRLRTLVPLRRWRLEVEGDVLRVRASSIVGPWDIPLSSLRCISLRYAEDGAYEWPFADEDLARTPNRVQPHASYGAGSTVELWLAPPGSPPVLRYPLAAGEAPEPAQAIDEVDLPLSPRRAVAFFASLGVPPAASYMDAAARTVGLVPAGEPGTQARREEYEAELARWRRRRSGRARRGALVLAACVTLIAGVIAFVPPGTGGWHAAVFSSTLVAFAVAMACVPVVVREARHRLARRLLSGGSSPG